MKTIWTLLVAAILFVSGPALAIESGHNCAEGNDQDLKWAEQQIKKPAPPSS